MVYGNLVHGPAAFLEYWLVLSAVVLVYGEPRPFVPEVMGPAQCSLVALARRPGDIPQVV